MSLAVSRLPSASDERTSPVDAYPTQTSSFDYARATDPQRAASHRNRKSRSSRDAHVPAVILPDERQENLYKHTVTITATATKDVKKGSFKSAFRRMLGRRSYGHDIPSLDSQPRPTLSVPASRHGYTSSDPGFSPLVPNHTSPAADAYAVPPRRMLSSTHPSSRSTSYTKPPQRTLSAPFKSKDTTITRSPHLPCAVEFPQSARLKPLDLANPFYSGQRPLRRRATVPSLVLDNDQVASLARAINDKNEDYKVEEEHQIGTFYDNDTGTPLSTPAKISNRRSRSADDLRDMITSQLPSHERTEEIKAWRQSVAGSVFRESPAFSRADYTPISTIHEVTHMAQTSKDAFGSSNAESVTERGKISPEHEGSPTMRPGTSLADLGHELESRVARLESGLCNFQGALDHLVARSNHDVMEMDNLTTSSRRSSHINTPSILINSLLDADYRYSSYTTNVEEPRSPREARPEEQLPQQRPSPTQHISTRHYTALYNIINTERTARRALENQVRDLQQNLIDIQEQLSQPILRRSSPAYSHRPAPQPPYKSNLIHSIQMQGYGDSIDNNVVGNRLTSRFSLSDSLTDSEAARLRDSDGLQDEHETHRSMDLYLTHADEQRQHTSRIMSEGGMF